MAPKKSDDASKDPQATGLAFRNPPPGSDGSMPEDVRRGEGLWANGCWFTNPDTGRRVWVPDSNLLCVAAEG